MKTNNNYDDEATTFGPQSQEEQNEETQIFNDSNSSEEETVMDEEKVEEEAVAEPVAEAEKPKGAVWKNIGVGAASGLVIGGLSTFLMGMAPNPKEGHEGKKGEDPNNTYHLSHPEWTDGEVPVATNVNDDMSFSEAFAAAREEVGPGGCFEWHGQVYGTYTAQEWNSMSQAERNEYNSHFAWSHFDSPSTSANSSHMADNSGSHASQPADDGIEVISVDHPEVAQNTTQNTHQPEPAQPHHPEPGPQVAQNTTQNIHQPEPAQPHHPEPGPQPTPGPEPEVEILGVYHDPEEGRNIGVMRMGGEDVILVDVDDDLTFDVMVVDANHNGHVDDGEMRYIGDQNITVADLGGFSNPTGDLYASDTTSDPNDDFSGEC